MKLKISLIQNNSEWDHLLQLFSRSLLQTSAWGDFNSKGLNKEVQKIALYDKEKPVALALCIIEVGRFGSYIYIPRGPLIDWNNGELVSNLFEELKNYFASENPVFIRFDPAIFPPNDVSQVFQTIFKVKSPYNTQVKRAWVLNLEGGNSEELMKHARQQGMHKKFPGEIRRAEQKGVSYRRAYSIDDFKIFYRLLDETSTKKGFKIRPEEYYLKEFEFLSKSDLIRLYISEFEGEPLSVALVGKYNKEGSYLHAASADKHSNLSAQGFLLWKIIEELHSEGFKRFNFWGVVDENNLQDSSHTGYGYSKFKMRFGGHVEEYVGSHDIIMRPVKYRLTWVQEKYRKWRLGLE